MDDLHPIWGGNERMKLPNNLMICSFITKKIELGTCGFSVLFCFRESLPLKSVQVCRKFEVRNCDALSCHSLEMFFYEYNGWQTSTSS